MYVHSAKLVSFKSIGDYPEAEVILEPRVTAIIGKNESGKSNVLEGLSKIDFLKHNPSAFSNDLVNRSSPIGAQITYLIRVIPTIMQWQKNSSQY